MLNIPLTRRGSIMEIFNSEAYSKYVLALFNNDTKQNREAIAEVFGTSDWKDLHEEFGEKPYESVQDFYARHQGMIFDYLSDQRDLEWNDLIKSFRDQKDYVIVADLGTWKGRRSSSLVKQGLNNAIEACLGNGTICFEVNAKRKALHVTAHHHDGTDYFQIFFCKPNYLNSKVLEKYQDDLYYQIKSARPTCLKANVLTDEMIESLGLH